MLKLFKLNVLYCLLSLVNKCETVLELENGFIHCSSLRKDKEVEAEVFDLGLLDLEKDC